MSAKALAACSFGPTAVQAVATNHQAPEGSPAAIQFRKDLWREYRFEAINAGFNSAQATEYANALSQETSLPTGVSVMAPVGRGWFYQSQPGVARRTFNSGLITLALRDKRKTIGRTATAGASALARRFRWWNARVKG
jgi:hypothetical protein